MCYLFLLKINYNRARHDSCQSFLGRAKVLSSLFSEEYLCQAYVNVP